MRLFSPYMLRSKGYDVGSITFLVHLHRTNKEVEAGASTSVTLHRNQ